jgi:beta-galactosidase
LNGQHVKIKGTNNHQDHAGVGSALPDYLQYYRIEQLKEFGSNAYRASHHAPTPELLDACDSLGMLVLDENRLLNSSPQYMKDFENLLKRDRSRASVFLWSIGNEEGYIQGNNTGKLIAETLIAKQRELDPTRVTTYAADMANVFKGVNEVVPVRGFNYRQFAVADYHKDHPTQPIIGTEMGSTVTTRGQYEKDTVIGYVPDQDITAPWWASKAETWWQLAAPNDFWLGGFIWTGFDYRGEPTPYKWPNINSHFGMMDVCGFPKNIYYYYQSWWTDKDVLHLSPHWNWAGKEGQPIDVWVNTNAENVELFLNDKSLGKKEMPRNGHLQWAVPYEAGVLKAVAQKKEKQLTAQVQTTSVPYKVVISPSKTTVLADGKDATVFNISVVDKAGLEVPTANTLITFKLAGDAQIIGVGNGDPSSHEADKCEEGKWQRRLFNGKCQVILQSGKTAQKLSFEANANGIEGAKIEVIQH